MNKKGLEILKGLQENNLGDYKVLETKAQHCLVLINTKGYKEYLVYKYENELLEQVCNTDKAAVAYKYWDKIN